MTTTAPTARAWLTIHKWVTHHEGDYNGDEHSQYYHLADFVMKGNWIDDVKSASEWDVKYPTRPERSIKTEAQKIINGQECLG